MKTWFKNNWIKLVAIGMLLGALSAIPYAAYFQLMNWLVVVAALVVVRQAYRQNNLWIVWLFVFVAILFNPVAPIYLPQSLWRNIDIVTAVIFAASLWVVKGKERN